MPCVKNLNAESPYAPFLYLDHAHDTYILLHTARDNSVVAMLGSSLLAVFPVSQLQHNEISLTGAGCQQAVSSIDHEKNYRKAYSKSV